MTFCPLWHNVNWVNVITRKRLDAYAAGFPDAAGFLDAWRLAAKRAKWRNLADVRRQYPHADPVKVGSGGTATVFNVCGNKYRLVVAIHYDAQRVYVLRMMTHARYSKGRWKLEL